MRADFGEQFNPRSYDPKEEMIERKEIHLFKQQSLPVLRVEDCRPRDLPREHSYYGSDFKKPNQYSKSPARYRNSNQPPENQAYSNPDSYFASRHS